NSPTTLYGPGTIPVTKYDPTVLLTTCRKTPLSWCVTMTTTPGSAAPDSSRTRPCTADAWPCAAIAATACRVTKAATTTIDTRRMCPPSLCRARRCWNSDRAGLRVNDGDRETTARV